MISRKLNKQRRRQAFRKLFASRPEFYRFVNWKRCVVGQMIVESGFDIGNDPQEQIDNLADGLKHAADFYGLDAETMNSVMFHSGGWDEYVGHEVSNGFEGALETLDVLLTGKRI